MLFKIRKWRYYKSNNISRSSQNLYKQLNNANLKGRRTLASSTYLEKYVDGRLLIRGIYRTNASGFIQIELPTEFQIDSNTDIFLLATPEYTSNEHQNVCVSQYLNRNVIVYVKDMITGRSCIKCSYTYSNFRQMEFINII